MTTTRGVQGAGTSVGARAATAILAVLVLLAGCTSAGTPARRAGVPSATAGTGGRPARCPATVDASAFTTAGRLRSELRAFNAFGLRSPGSDAGEASLDWLGDRFAAIPGVTVRWDGYAIDRWQPTPDAPGRAPGRDLAAAGSLRLPGGDVEVIGAVPFAAPTGDEGVTAPLVHIPSGEAITAANAAGRIVVRDIPHSTAPWAGIVAISHHATRDLPRAGDYDRPYARSIDDPLLAAGRAGAAGIVLQWDAPTDQMRGYWDPHSGLRFEVPGVYVGSDHAPEVVAAAERGDPATITVRAAWDRARTRNLSATLPGLSRERIILTANSDSVTWVQEDGTIGALALLRHFASLPRRCRPRTIEVQLTASHLAMASDGSNRVVSRLDEDYDRGTVAFVVALEHLGSREIEPGAHGRLHFTGRAEFLSWSAPTESPALVEASVAAVKRRRLPRTAVFIGTGGFGGPRPSVCSQGGLGTPYHAHLIPTIGVITGPWSLWAPAFGSRAVDPSLMRDQLLALGDVVTALRDRPRAEIAGRYLAMRKERAAGEPTCADPDGTSRP